MSLFGTSPDEPSRTQIKSSLFDDEAVGAAQKQGSGLFADTPSEDNSPWAFTSPKKQARGNLIKTLLPASQVPEYYIDAFDALLQSSNATGSGLSLAIVRKYLQSTNLTPGQQGNILDVVTSSGQTSTIDRGEFNVLLALIGLTQEGDDATLDGVDERRSRLPNPTLPQIQRRAADIPAQRNGAAPSERIIPSRTVDQPAPKAQGMEGRGFSYTDADPWGSPTQGRQAAAAPLANGAANNLDTAMPPRTTSNFSTQGDQLPVEGGSEPPHSAIAGTWDSYNGDTTGAYGAPDIDGGFGAPGHHEVQQSSTRQPRVMGNRPVNHGQEEVVQVIALPEKQGMLLFQYRNYEVSSARRNSKVIRRYSDFVWLLDCLHKKYPFRQLPLLPPKRASINGNHIGTDALFIEKRRRGLVRFINALVRHPVLQQEQLVVMFLTVPTELSIWRKQASFTVQEEFVGKTLPPTLEDSLPPSLEDLFATVRSGVRRSTDIYIALCSLIERVIKRKEGLAAEYGRLSLTLQTVAEVSEDTYHIDTNDVPLLNEGINASAKHISTGQTLLEDESRGWDEGVLEDFKRQRDGLVSMRDMFDRRDRLSKDNIHQLERKIQSNESKLGVVRAKPDHLKKAGEAEKLEDAIMKDKELIVQQHARSVFIKECVRDEIQFFQSSQFHISRLHQDWAQERVKYAELQADNWKSLSDEIDGMPLGE